MEINIDKRFALMASPAAAWAVLCDVRATAQCMPGASIGEQIDATHYKGSVVSKVGPASMSFAGSIEVLALDAAARSVQMLGKGADRGGSSAAMKLTAHIEDGATPGEAVLVGQAAVTVNGKLAQFGSRLIVPVADAMLVQFAANFGAAAAAAALAAVATPTASAEASASTSEASKSPTFDLTPSAAAARAAPANELNALSLLWLVFRTWLGKIFGRRG